MPDNDNINYNKRLKKTLSEVANLTQLLRNDITDTFTPDAFEYVAQSRGEEAENWLMACKDIKERALSLFAGMDTLERLLAVRLAYEEGDED